MGFVSFIRSSIGKKWIMAVSGLLLLVFLFSHIAGASTLYLGRDAFQRYADQLHSHMLFLSIFRIGLFSLFMIHSITGLLLFYQNRKARPTPYRITARSGIDRSLSPVGTSFGVIMLSTGLATLGFLIIHIFGFIIGRPEAPISQTVVTLLGHPGYGLLYIFFFLVLALHLHHGFWSLFQTLGLSHPRYMLLTTRLTTIVPIFFLIVAGGLPLLFICGASSR